MGEMGHVAAESRPAQEQLDHAVNHHEPFGLHRNGRNEQHDDRIGMHHAESQQKPHHRSRRADELDGHFARQVGRRQLDQRRTDAADHVVDQKTLRPQLVLQRPAEHPQCEHVEEDMLDAGMQEHVGDELVGVELAEGRRPEPERAEADDLVAHGQQRRGHIDQDIDDYQVFDHRRGLKIAVHGIFCRLSVFQFRLLRAAGPAPIRVQI